MLPQNLGERFVRLRNKIRCIDTFTIVGQRPFQRGMEKNDGRPAGIGGQFLPQPVQLFFGHLRQLAGIQGIHRQINQQILAGLLTVIHLR